MSVFVSALVTGAAAATVFSTLWIITGLVVRGWRESIGSRIQWQRRLQRLVPGATEDYLCEVLAGAPVLRGLEGSWIRQVFLTPHAAVVVVGTAKSPCLTLSITVTDRRFNVPLKRLTSDFTDAALNSMTFSALPVEAEGRYLMSGANWKTYREVHYGARPAAYQWFRLSYNDAGVGTFGAEAAAEVGGQVCHGVLAGEAFGVPCPPLTREQQVVRANTTVNTVAVSQTAVDLLLNDFVELRAEEMHLIGVRGANRHGLASPPRPG